MHRQFSASIFFLGMVLLVLLKQPLLAYCPCSESFFVEECGCAEVEQEVCPCQQTEKAPCDDCRKVILLDLDELFWSSIEVPNGSEVKVSATAQDKTPGKAQAISSRTFSYVLPETRPPPLADLPLYLSLCVLRL